MPTRRKPIIVVARQRSEADAADVFMLFVIILIIVYLYNGRTKCCRGANPNEFIAGAMRGSDGFGRNRPFITVGSARITENHSHIETGDLGLTVSLWKTYFEKEKLTTRPANKSIAGHVKGRTMDEIYIIFR